MPHKTKVPGHLSSIKCIVDDLEIDKPYYSQTSPQMTIDRIYRLFVDSGSIDDSRMVLPSVSLTRHKSDGIGVDYYTASLDHIEYSTPLVVTLSDENGIVLVTFAGTLKTVAKQEAESVQSEIERGLDLIRADINKIDNVLKLKDVRDRILFISENLATYKSERPNYW